MIGLQVGLGQSGGNIIATGSVALGATIAPATLAAGTYNDYSPVDATTGVTLANATQVDITITGGGLIQLNGMAGGVPGRLVILRQVTSGVILINSENAGSVAANRFHAADLVPEIGSAGKSLTFFYDGSISRWVLISQVTDLYNYQVQFQGGAVAFPLIIQSGASAYAQLYNGSSVAAGSASTGRLIYNATTQTFQVSQNAGAYVPVVTGSIVDNGTAAGTSEALYGATVSTAGASGPKWSGGAGAPTIAGAVGDLYSRTDGGLLTSLYVCTTAGGAGAATWTGK